MLLSWGVNRWEWHGWRPRRLSAPLLFGYPEGASQPKATWWRAGRVPGPIRAWSFSLSFGYGNVWLWVEFR